MDRSLLQRGTTKHLQTHKHNNPRQAARAFFVPIGVFAIKIGRFRCKPIAQMPSDMSTVLRGQIYKITNNSPFSKYISQKNNQITDYAFEIGDLLYIIYIGISPAWRIHHKKKEQTFRFAP